MIGNGKLNLFGIWVGLNAAIGKELGGIMTAFAVNLQHERSCTGVIVPSILSLTSVPTILKGKLRRSLFERTQATGIISVKMRKQRLCL
jgi:hypothetical protein